MLGVMGESITEKKGTFTECRWIGKSRTAFNWEELTQARYEGWAKGLVWQTVCKNLVSRN